MKKQLLSLNQLYSLILVSAAIPLLALVSGFHMAWQYYEKSPPNPPVVLSHQVIQSGLQDDSGVHTNQSLERAVDTVNHSVAAYAAEFVPPNPVETLSSERQLQPRSVLSESQIKETFDVDHAFAKESPNYALQIGAFGTKKRAAMWANQHKLGKYRVMILLRTVEGRHIYAVVVTGFDSRTDAQFAKQELRIQNGLDGFIIKRSSKDKEIHIRT